MIYLIVRYTFTGWNTRKDGKGIAIKNAASVSKLTNKGSITLYAQWKKNKTKQNKNGGEHEKIYNTIAFNFSCNVTCCLWK